MTQALSRPSSAGAPSFGKDKSAPTLQRLDSIDVLRGLIMVIMALDHARDYFTNVTFYPMELDKTTPALYLTRWITHFCAPNFVFLAGTGAFLFSTRGRTKNEVAWFLLTRGLWLAFLEVTAVQFAWQFRLDYHNFGVGTLWSIGWSMVALAGLVYLPLSAIVVLGVTMICFHNLFDDVSASDLGPWGWLWPILHSGETIRVHFQESWHQFGWHWEITKSPMMPADEPGFQFSPGYKLIPWIGVMAAGYGFGAMYLLEPRKRRTQLWGLGIALTVAFVAIRYANRYGDPNHWTPQKDLLFTAFSFCHCEKYPPSLSYLLMTIGPAIALLALFERGTGWLGRFLVVYGRVPLFFYLLHIPLIHALVFAITYYGHDKAAPEWLYNFPSPGKDGFDLPIVYLVWAGVVVFLWPFCYWFSEVKRRHKDWTVLSYL